MMETNASNPHREQPSAESAAPDVSATPELRPKAGATRALPAVSEDFREIPLAPAAGLNTSSAPAREGDNQGGTAGLSLVPDRI